MPPNRNSRSGQGRLGSASELPPGVLVDAEDLDRVLAAGSWYVRADGYVVANRGEWRGEYLHRFVTGCTKGDGKVVDHENHNRSDNRKQNLIPGTYGANNWNRRGADKDSKTGVRGVYWDRVRGRYLAQFQKGGKRTHVGYFDTIEEAAREIERRRDGGD